MSKNTTLDAWTEVCRSLFGSKKKATSVHPIHSCIIDGERHYIHSPDLERDDPTYYRQLKAFAAKNHIQLKADRRERNEEKFNNRRKKLLPIMFLSFGLSAQTIADEFDVSLKIVPENVWIEEEAPASTTLNSDTPIAANEAVAKRLHTILAKHFIPQKNDPDSMADDLYQLAQYYSGHTEAASLIESLDGADWALKYSPHTFQTNIQGSRLSIKKVTVYFDPRSAAKLKFYDKCDSKKPFCVASPADALLHELLHVQTAVHDTDRFIRQGGLNQHVYPAEHERLTILKENILYKSMSRRDHIPRPIRSEHTGRHVLVSCVTCLE